MTDDHLERQPVRRRVRRGLSRGRSLSEAGTPDTEVLEAAQKLIRRILTRPADRPLAEHWILENAHRSIMTERPVRGNTTPEPFSYLREMQRRIDVSPLSYQSGLYIDVLERYIENCREQGMSSDAIYDSIRTRELLSEKDQAWRAEEYAWERYREAIQWSRNLQISLVRQTVQIQNALSEIRAGNHARRPASAAGERSREAMGSLLKMIQAARADLHDYKNVLQIAEGDRVELRDRQARWNYMESFEDVRREAGREHIEADLAYLASILGTERPQEIRRRRREQAEHIAARERALAEVDRLLYRAANDFRIPATDLERGVTTRVIGNSFKLTQFADPNSSLWRQRFWDFLHLLCDHRHPGTLSLVEPAEMRRYLTELAQVENALAEKELSEQELLVRAGVRATNLPADNAELADRMNSLAQIRLKLARQTTLALRDGPWWSSEAFLLPEVGIGPESQQTPSSAVKRREQLRALDMQYNAVRLQEDVVSGRIGSYPSIQEMLSPRTSESDRKEIYERLSSEVADLDSLVRSTLSLEAQHQVLARRHSYLRIDELMAAEKSGLLNPDWRDLFTSLEGCADMLARWNTSVPNAGGFNELSDWLRDAASKEHLIRFTPLELLKRERASAAIESLIDQQVTVEEVQLGLLKLSQLRAAGAVRIERSLEPLQRLLEAVVQNQVRARELLLEADRPRDHRNTEILGHLRDAKALARTAQLRFLGLKSHADEIRGLRGSDPNSAEVRERVERMLTLTREALESAREYEIKAEEMAGRLEEFERDQRSTIRLGAVLATARAGQRARIERDRAPSDVPLRLEESLTSEQLPEWRAARLAAFAIREREFAEETVYNLRLLCEGVPGLEPWQTRPYFGLVAASPEEWRLFKTRHQNFLDTLARVGTPDPSSPGKLFQPADVAEVRNYWEAVHGVYALKRTAEHLGLAYDWQVESLFTRENPPPLEEIRPEIETLKLEVRLFQGALERELQDEIQTGLSAVQIRQNENRMASLKKQIALEQARTTLYGLDLTDDRLALISRIHAYNTAGLAAALSGAANEAAGTQQVQARDAPSLDFKQEQEDLEFNRRLLSDIRATLLTAASDAGKIGNQTAEAIGKLEALVRQITMLNQGWQIHSVRNGESARSENVGNAGSVQNTDEDSGRQAPHNGQQPRVPGDDGAPGVERLDAINELGELRRRAEQARRTVAASEPLAGASDVSRSEQVPRAVDTPEARRREVAIAASEPSSPAGEWGRVVGRLATGALEHGATAGFGLLAATQLGDAFLKSDRQAFFQSLVNAGILTTAAAAPWTVGKWLGARAGGVTASGIGFTFTAMSTIAGVQAYGAYREAAKNAQNAHGNSLKEAKAAMENSSWATLSNGIDAAAAGAASLGSILPSASRLRGGTRLTALVTGAGSLAMHFYDWYKGPEGTRAAGELLLKTAGIIAPAGEVNNGQSESGQQQTAAAKQKEDLDRLGVLKDSGLGQAVVV